MIYFTNDNVCPCCFLVLNDDGTNFHDGKKHRCKKMQKEELTLSEGIT
jgi:hypothetical protein